MYRRTYMTDRNLYGCFEVGQQVDMALRCQKSVMME
jgi:hypothetical protein